MDKNELNIERDRKAASQEYQSAILSRVECIETIQKAHEEPCLSDEEFRAIFYDRNIRGNAIEASTASEAFVQKLLKFAERNSHLSIIAENKELFEEASFTLKLIQHLKAQLAAIEDALRQNKKEMDCLGRKSRVSRVILEIAV